jgi:hypothetical protein
MATQKGVWDLQEVRDKQLADEWIYKFAATDAGALYAWGRGYRGMLGLNQAHDFFVSSPTQVGTDTTWILSNTGRDASHFNVIKSNGTLWSWGYNHFGQLAQNNETSYSSPIQVGTDTTWAAGGSTKYNTSRGIKTDGTLWTWGRNLYGQLGQNTPNNTYQSSPVQLPGTTWSSSITKNNSSYLANANIKTDGTLWIWGYGEYGKLGQNESSPQRSSPVQVPGTTWNTISGSYQSFLATKTDGTLWGWGLNYRGNLALNNIVKYSSPTQIGTETTWSKFGGSNTTVGAIKTDGTLWCWGTGGSGEIGNNIGGPGKHHSSPVQVGTDTTWNLIGGGSLEMIATKTDGTLWAWGSNSYGGLGQNSRTNLSSPTQIPGTGWIFSKGGLVNLATKSG